MKVHPLKVYLGDSVYVDTDGLGLILTTENGYPDDPRNRIVLEPEVYTALVQYVERLTTPKESDATENTSQQ